MDDRFDRVIAALKRYPRVSQLMTGLLAGVLMLMLVMPSAFACSSRPAGGTSRAEWVEVSRGAFPRAIRHVRTGRCFVRYADGGLVETGIDVCSPAR